MAEKDIARLSGVATTQTSPKTTTSVDNIKYFETPNSVRIVVDVGGDVRFVQGEAKGPDRVFIDVTPARLSSAMTGKQFPLKSSLLQQIRVGQYDLSTVRIVLVVGTIGRVTSFTLRDPDRLIIDVQGKDAPITTGPDPIATPTESIAAAPTPSDTLKVAAKPAAIPASASKKSPEKLDPKPDNKPPDTKLTAPSVSPAATATTTAPTPTPTPAPAPAPAAEAKVIVPAKATNAGTRSLVRSLGLKLHRVVIDAGHGGHDTGTIGPGGYTEKELVLDVAMRLKALIENEMGAEVVMTRSDDSFIPLESRTAIANQQEADLFISIHANSSHVRSVHGVETYYLNFTSSRENLETASRENAASERPIHELQDMVKKIMLRDKVDESRELAEHIEHALAARKGSGLDRGVKQAPFVVLIGANMPSILAEVCFISNPNDEKSAKKPDGRQAIADSLFEGVKSYAESLSGTKTAKVQDKTN
jgi:N-acetylmuramoyl-L-alanine amidase